METTDHAHIFSLMYKLLTSSKDSDDLSIVFDRSRDRRRKEFTKENEGKYHLRIYLGDFFGFAEHQETATFGLGYKLTLTKIAENAVLK